MIWYILSSRGAFTNFWLTGCSEIRIVIDVLSLRHSNWPRASDPKTETITGHSLLRSSCANCIILFGRYWANSGPPYMIFTRCSDGARTYDFISINFAESRKCISCCIRKTKAPIALSKCTWFITRIERENFRVWWTVGTDYKWASTRCTNLVYSRYSSNRRS